MVVSFQLPDHVQDFIQKYVHPQHFSEGVEEGKKRKKGTGASDRLQTHCRRELFHGCWRIILDDEFIHAYRHGIVVECGDGIHRRIYPRIFTYSADYPEK
jgi:hypothetical protein